MKVIDFQNPECRKILEDGYVLSFPTETVYGVGVRFDSEEAYERLCKAKNRRPDKAIAVMCSDTFNLDEFFEISDGAKKVIEYFLPGPLTCLVKARDNAPYQTHLGTYVAGIRIPEKKELLEFLKTLPFALQVTSANMSGQPSLDDFESVYKVFKDSEEVKGIVKGTCQSGTPTTVVDLTKDKPIVIRQGEITLKQIEEVFYNK